MHGGLAVRAVNLEGGLRSVSRPFAVVFFSWISEARFASFILGVQNQSATRYPLSLGTFFTHDRRVTAGLSLACQRARLLNPGFQ